MTTRHDYYKKLGYNDQQLARIRLTAADMKKFARAAHPAQVSFEEWARVANVLTENMTATKGTL